MSQHKMRQTISIVGFALTGILLSISLAWADIRSATGKPLLDFYTVYGAIDSVKIINELCNTKFLEFKKQNDRAYNVWRSRHKEFIYKVEQYNHMIVTKTSKGDEASYRKQMIETALLYEQNKAAMQHAHPIRDTQNQRRQISPITTKNTCKFLRIIGASINRE